MVQWHTKSFRKSTGGIRYSANARDKYLSERGGDIANTTLAEGDGTSKIKSIRTRGKNKKVKVLRTKSINVTDSKTKKTSVWELVSVKENQANRQFARKNIVTKNAIIEAKNGSHTALCRVTSRPGQSGTVNAVLLTEAQTKEFLDKIAKAPSQAKPKAQAKTHAKAKAKKTDAAEKTTEN